MAAADVLRSTAFRLAAAATAAIVAVAVLAVGLVGRHVNQRLTEATEAAIERDVADLRRTLDTGGFDALAEAVDARTRGAVAGALYYLADADGGRRAGNLAAPPAAVTGGSRGIFVWQPRAGEDPRTAAGIVARLDGAGVLVVARDVDEQRAFLDLLRRDLLLALGAIALVGLAGGAWLARAVLTRVGAMAEASRTIMGGNLSERLPRTGSDDELDRLAAQLNAMLERIERLMAGLREVSDNIAHDLKTPLNRLRNRAEAALADRREGAAWREGLEQTIEAADEIIKTFNALLLIARLEAGALEKTLEPVDLAEVVSGVAELYEPLAEEAGLTLRTDVAGPAPVSANRQLVGQAIANLVDNAIKYGGARDGTRGAADGRTAAGPAITVSLTTTATHASLAVADRGPGIPAADRQRALGRFVRLDASRSKPGTGLGLSLVAAVAEMHRGAIALEDNGPGLRVVLTLPLAGRDAAAARTPAARPRGVPGERRAGA